MVVEAGRPLPARSFAPASAYSPNGYWDGASNGDEEQDRADLTCLGKCGVGAFPLHMPPFAVPLLPRAIAERRSFVTRR